MLANAGNRLKQTEITNKRVYMNELTEMLGVKMHTWQILSLDVWADIIEEDCEACWVKNDFFKLGTLDLPDCGISDAELIQELIDCGICTDNAHELLEVLNTGCEGYIELVRKTDGYPVLDLKQITY